MHEWVEDQLGNLASIEIGGTPARGVDEYWAQHESAGHPWVSISDLGPRIVLETKERITDLGVRNSNVKHVPTGALMMSFKLTIGRVGIAGRDLYTNEAIATVLPLDGRIDGGLLYYILPGTALNAITDTAVKGVTLNKQKLHQLLIRYPAKPTEQRRIAEILSVVDDAIEQTEALIAKMQQIKAGLMHDLFTRGVMPDGRLRPPREEAPNLYKESHLGWIPGEWKIGGIEAYLQVGGLKPGPFGSALTKADYSETGYRVYGQEQVLAGKLSEGNYYIPESKWRELQGFAIQEGDLLMTLVGVGTVGKILVVRAPFEPGIINPRLMRMRPDRSVCCTAFLAQLIPSALVRRQFNLLATGGTMPVLNGSIVRKVRVPIVALAEQEVIAARLESSDAGLTAGTVLLEKLRYEKAGLMHDLLTGRVRVPIAEKQKVEANV